MLVLHAQRAKLAVDGPAAVEAELDLDRYMRVRRNS
jgi:hypothetical protein